MKTYDKDWKQGPVEHELLDNYRDNNWFIVYKCKTCGFRGVGASVTLHPYEHGPMERENVELDSKNDKTNIGTK